MGVRIRYRLPELLNEHDTTAYAIVQASGGALDMSTLYRLVRQRGRVKFIDGRVVGALCDVLGVGINDVLALERTNEKRKPRKRRS